MQALLEAIDQRVEPERRDAVAAFAKAFLRRFPAEELGVLGVDGLVGMVRAAFDLADRRGAHPSAVRVFHADVATDGYDTVGSIIETSTDDSPFLVDSIQEELLARGLGVSRLLHPVIGTIRDENGRIERVMSGRDANHRESVMHFELDRVLTAQESADLERRVTTILRDVRLVVRDFEPMQQRVRHMIELARTAAIRYPPQEVGEAIDFLGWLAQLNFVLLGYREYELVDVDGEQRAAIRAVSGSGLGILSDLKRSAFAETTRLVDLDEVVRARIEGGDLLVFSKTNSYSTVHRRARMDYIGVRVVDAEGLVTGEARLIGLFTSKAYMEPAAKTPLLHHKLEQIITAEDLIPGSHDYKEVVELFESFPKDELFQASADELRRLVIGLLQLEKHGGIRVLVRRDLYGRSVSVVVALPRDRFNAALRKRLQQYFLEEFHGNTVDYHLSLGETESARIFFTVHVDPTTRIPDVPYEQLEAEVERLARSWDDDLRDVLIARAGPVRGPVLAEKYAPRFPSYYKASEEWDLIADDVLALEALESDPEGYLVGIGNEREGERLTRVKLYKTGGKVDLSAFIPILEALGLRAVEEIPTQVLGEGKTYIHDFGVLDSRGAVLDLGKEAQNVSATISAVWRGEAESDSLNRLVTLTDLDWRQVQILRALRKYRMRVSSRYTEEYRNDAMADQAQISSALVHMFEAKFDPDRAATDEDDRRDPAVDPCRPPRGDFARPGQHPAQPARHDRSHRPYERVCARTIVAQLQASLGAGPGDAEALPVVRDLRALPAHGSDPSARGHGRQGRYQVVRPQGGLPHRSARTHEGAEGEERRDRARRFEGRLHLAPHAGEPRGAQGGSLSAIRDVHARHARYHRQPHRRRGRAPARCARPRRRRPLPRRRR